MDSLPKESCDSDIIKDDSEIEEDAKEKYYMHANIYNHEDGNMEHFTDEIAVVEYHEPNGNYEPHEYLQVQDIDYSNDNIEYTHHDHNHQNEEDNHHLNIQHGTNWLPENDQN